MPQAKLWYFETTADKLFVLKYAGGSDVRKRNKQPLGVIRSIEQLPQDDAGDVPAKLVQDILKVTCKEGITKMNVTNLIWKENSFSAKFRGVKTAADLLDRWEAAARYEPEYNAMCIRDCPDTDEDDEEDLLLLPSDSSISDSSRKRAVSVIDSQPLEKPPKKKRDSDDCTAYIKDDMDAEIEKKKLGTIPRKVQVKQCQMPPPQRLLRTVDDIFVRSLKDQLIADPTGPGVPPLALLCMHETSPDKFREDRTQQYQYEVLGGLHSVQARQSLLEDYPEHPLYSEALAHIYCGLTDEEALRLAMRHNVNGHFTHSLTHKDYVVGCRARLYVMAGKNPLKDPTPKVNQEWKRACLKCILPKGIVSTRSANIFAQASFSVSVFDLAMSVMNLFEDGGLKGQKETRTKKQLLSKPEFRQHYFEALQGLEEDFQKQVLEKVEEKKISGRLEAGCS